jgi:hypothetical protein
MVGGVGVTSKSVRYLFFSLTSCLALAAIAHAEDNDDPLQIISSDRLKLRANAELGVQFASEDNLFWHLSDNFAPSQKFNPDRSWWEGYLKLGLQGEAILAPRRTVYGGVSFVASGTWRKDAFDNGNTGRVTLEDGYVGLRWARKNQMLFDLSTGAQPFVVGSGMLISNGASNGFERGAMKLGPRKAFEMTGIGRFTYKKYLAESFFVDANELPANDSSTQIVGAHIAWKANENQQAGFAYGKAISSGAPYPQAGSPENFGIPTIIQGGRKGLSFVQGYGKVVPFQKKIPQLWMGADLAYEWNDRIDMKAYGYRVETGYQFKERRFKPSIKYGYQLFSGDDPDTKRLERFDPLFYEGSPGAWATGNKSSMVFINTNVNAHQVQLDLTLSKKDLMSLYAAHVQATKLRSPLQFGQASRPIFTDSGPMILTGVTNHHLSDDIMLKYTRIVNKNTYVTTGLSASFPGAGMDELAGGNAPVWSGIFVNMVLKF